MKSFWHSEEWMLNQFMLTLISFLQSLATEIDEGMCSLEVCEGGSDCEWISEFYTSCLKPQSARCYLQTVLSDVKEANCLGFFFLHSIFLSY